MLKIVRENGCNTVNKFNIKMYSQILKNRDTKLILSQYILDINLLKQGFVIAKAIEWLVSQL